MEIYIKPKKRVEIQAQQEVKIGDIAEIYAKPSAQIKAAQIPILRPKSDGAYLISSMDIIRAIDMQLPGHKISNLGEMDCIVQYSKFPSKRNKKYTNLFNIIKVCIISLVLFVGASTAIMTFHTDSQMAKVFSRYHEIFFGKEIENPHIISIPYSIGLALGIILFFNHFSGMRLSEEPSPIEVEMSSYQKDVEDSMIATLQEQQEEEQQKEQQEGES